MSHSKSKKRSSRKDQKTTPESGLLCENRPHQNKNLAKPKATSRPLDDELFNQIKQKGLNYLFRKYSDFRKVSRRPDAQDLVSTTFEKMLKNSTLLTKVPDNEKLLFGYFFRVLQSRAINAATKKAVVDKHQHGIFQKYCSAIGTDPFITVSNLTPVFSEVIWFLRMLFYDFIFILSILVILKTQKVISILRDTSMVPAISNYARLYSGTAANNHTLLLILPTMLPISISPKLPILQHAADNADLPGEKRSHSHLSFLC